MIPARSICTATSSNVLPYKPVRCRWCMYSTNGSANFSWSFWLLAIGVTGPVMKQHIGQQPWRGFGLHVVAGQFHDFGAHGSIPLLALIVINFNAPHAPWQLEFVHKVALHVRAWVWLLLPQALGVHQESFVAHTGQRLLLVFLL